ncbi:DUF6301 family protein [Nocardia yamanashiensis]|uniref:DUF6301 family protein n=1 Tax=Nocardia yamanashiensis TaxID=209247 RepID=UPI00082F22DD|nr:DUF6301 family protein [Nocardia yamanashiensis]
MHADVDTARVLARIAQGFEWTWKLDDMTRLCAAAGWSPPIPMNLGLYASTDCEVLRPDAWALLDNGDPPRLSELEGPIEAVIVRVADLDDASDEPPTESELAQCHSMICEALSVQLGSPSRRTDAPYPATRWDLPTVIVEVQSLTNAVDLGFVNPAYQGWLDEQSLSEDDEYC